MNCDYIILDGIYLVQEGHELDLHNTFDFKGLEYSVDKRELALRWEKFTGEWVKFDSPTAIKIKFIGVSEFRFMPRDTLKPYSEDDCLNVFGYLVDEEWAEGIVVVDPNQEPDKNWITALEFMSGCLLYTSDAADE